MYGFPEATEYGKLIPIRTFHENMEIAPALERMFNEQIRSICWKNKLAPCTLPAAAGEAVSEMEIFEIRLNSPRLDEAVLRRIDKGIPYHILFILTYEDRAQAWIGCKEADGEGAFKAGRYYHTEWMPQEKLQFRIDGLNMDAVYESLVRQVAGEALRANSGDSLKDAVARDERRRRLEKRIAALETKIRKEKQLNRRMEIHREQKRLKKDLGEL